MSYVEQLFDKMGLMRGEYAIPMRALVGASVSGLIISRMQPASMFTKGVARPWSLVSDGDGTVAPTSTPWFFVPAAGAFICSVLI